jgi:2,4-dienoyl-CoA reductase-like NADH-dependent reductase (Old Yellow Enzyme family)
MNDAQEAALKRVLTFIRSQGAAAGVQLAHAGRKGSTTAPWVARSSKAGVDVGGWPDDVVGPMGGPDEAWDGLKGEGRFCVPRALREEEMPALVGAFAQAARRAARAGADLVEIHSAHGYLLHQFLSPVTNRRTDGYGGSFEGRTRLLKEVVGAVREAVGESVAVFVRISTTDWLEGTEVEKERGGSWTVDDAVRLAKLLPGWGADLLDASSGGNHPAQTAGIIAQSGQHNDYQTKIAARIRREARAAGIPLLVGAVGLITEAERARDLVQAEAVAADAATDAREGREPDADLVFIARQFMREPEWVFRVANELGVDVAWPSQFLRVRLSKV